MRLLIFVALVGAALGQEPLSPSSYHETIGVPEAQRIQQLEEATDFDGARIVGGAQSKLGAHPYLGGLIITLTSGELSVCASTLLRATRLLTAAQCWWDGFYQGQSITAVLGSVSLYSGGTRVVTDNVLMHESFNPFNLFANLAILSFPAVELNDNIQPIALAGSNINLYAGMWAVAAGYGRKDDTAVSANISVVNDVVLHVLTNAACQQYHGTWSVTVSTICTSGLGGVGLCGGDTGGPLVIGHGSSRLLIGIASFSSPSGCQRGLPSVFSRLTSFPNWINNRL